MGLLRRAFVAVASALGFNAMPSDRLPIPDASFGMRYVNSRGRGKGGKKVTSKKSGASVLKRRSTKLRNKRKNRRGSR